MKRKKCDVALHSILKEEKIKQKNIIYRIPNFTFTCLPNIYYKFCGISVWWQVNLPEFCCFLFFGFLLLLPSTNLNQYNFPLIFYLKYTPKHHSVVWIEMGYNDIVANISSASFSDTSTWRRNTISMFICICLSCENSIFLSPYLCLSLSLSSSLYLLIILV